MWISLRTRSDKYIHIGLTENDLALPNVYFGDMGQDIKVTGSYCGYSFDHLIVFAPVEKPMLEREMVNFVRQLSSIRLWRKITKRISRDLPLKLRLESLIPMKISA